MFRDEKRLPVNRVANDKDGGGTWTKSLCLIKDHGTVYDFISFCNSSIHNSSGVDCRQEAVCQLLWNTYNLSVLEFNIKRAHLRSGVRQVLTKAKRPPSMIETHASIARKQQRHRMSFSLCVTGSASTGLGCAPSRRLTTGQVPST